MSADLTLPATIPGLLRWCSPLVHIGHKCICHNSGVHDGHGRINIGADVVALPGEVALDLTDATGRAHALWWLAKTPDVYWMFCGLAHPGDRTFGWEFRSASGGRRVFGPVDLPWQGTYVPALADLDPNDDRRLPDGSRWIDAEALRRVVLHVSTFARVPA